MTSVQAELGISDEDNDLCINAMRKAYRAERRHKLLLWAVVLLAIGQSIYIGMM